MKQRDNGEQSENGLMTRQRDDGRSPMQSGISEKATYVSGTIEDLYKIESRDTPTLNIRIADRITAFAGSMPFFWLNLIWFVVWVVINQSWFGYKPFDPFPFSLLTMIVSLEAIFLATFVLISQNRQSILADKRAKLDLEVNLISEKELTKLIELVAEMHHHMGIDRRHDPELRDMQERVPLEKLADALDEVEQQPPGSR